MITSGKFNSHCPLLGFDAVKNERGEYTGIYKPNREELKQVEWIMSTFLLVDRYKVLLDLCKERNIKTKRGKNFTKHSIRTLLTNPRYIGKWYRNRKNAGKRQNKLMPYERFTEVELTHGCVIDKGLWQQVQDKVKELDNSRAQATRHCFPLSGLLVLNDGSNFAGNSAWGRTRRSTYYYNNANKIRVRSEVFDSAAEKILWQVVENSPEFQKSLANYDARKENSIGILARKIAEIDTRLGELEGERQHLDKRLSFLLDDDDVAIAQLFRRGARKRQKVYERSEYKRRFSALNDEERELEREKSQLKQLLKHFKEAQDTNESCWLEQVNKALDYVRKKDLVSLRSTYRRMFDEIIVQRLDKAKVRLQFAFKNPTSPLSNGEVGFCISVDQLPSPHPSPANMVDKLVGLSYPTTLRSSHLVIRRCTSTRSEWS